jgi:hypothetical protein
VLKQLFGSFRKIKMQLSSTFLTYLKKLALIAIRNGQGLSDFVTDHPPEYREAARQAYELAEAQIVQNTANGGKK